MLWHLPVGHFASLEELLLPTQLAALLALMMAAGFVSLGRVLARRVLGADTTPLGLAASAIAVLAGTGAIVHALAWAGAVPLVPLRLVAWGLGALGLLELWRARPALPGPARIHQQLRALPRLDALLLLFAATTLGAMLLAALAPASDGDSLSYHLAVPLDWLREGGASARPDWFTARLAALGESLNLLGLAGGTDRFGAVAQFGGLVAAAIALSSVARDAAGKRLAWILVGSAPLFVSAVQSQKWQLLPAAALLVGTTLLVDGNGARSTARLALAGAVLTFAIASKTSFVVSAGIASLFVLALAWRAGTALPATLALASGVLLLAGPIWSRNALFYGDPVSPMLERLRESPDPLLVACAGYLRDAAYPRTLQGISAFVRDAFVPTGLATATEALGIGLVGLLVGWRFAGNARLFAALGTVAAVATLALTQLGSRFISEDFLWAAAALAAAGAALGRMGTALRWGLVPQAAVACGIALVSAALQFPGALSTSLRERVLTRSASDYADARWLDDTLPPAARVVSQLRSYAFVPRPFAAYRNCIELLPANPPYRACQLLRGIERGADHVVRRVPVDDGFALADAFATPTGARGTFREVSRNPFRPGAKYELEVLKVDVAKAHDTIAQFAKDEPWCGLKQSLPGPSVASAAIAPRSPQPDLP